MKQKSSLSLTHFVHKTLVQRLVLMTVLISLSVSAMVYLLEQQRMETYVAGQASSAVDLLVARARQISTEKGIDKYTAFHEAVVERLASREKDQTGSFVYAGFFKPDEELIDEFVSQDITNGDVLKKYFVKKPLIRPAADTQYLQRAQLDGHTYIYVVFSFIDVHQQVAAYTHGIFALSATTQTEIQNRIWRSVITTILIVLATSLLLYPVILRLVKRLTVFSANLLDANLQGIALLGSAIAKRDSDTDAHNYRVSIYSVRLAEAIGLDVESIRGLIKGAFLHDVGKIGIRDNILLKPGKLDDEEFTIMKTHVQHGLDIVERSPWLADAMDIVGGHHEKFAGGGYPSGLREDAIPITARIFAIADVFDALTSKRPYKEPLSFEKTMEILEQGSQQHFDPELLVVFKQIAPALYTKYCGREDDGLQEELNQILRQYFTSNVNSLMA